MCKGTFLNTANKPMRTNEKYLKRTSTNNLVNYFNLFEKYFYYSIFLVK